MLYDFSPLYPLMRKICNKSPQGRIEFVLAVMRHGLYFPLMAGECDRITERDFDRCFEMGDSDEVILGIIEATKEDPELVNAFKVADAGWWDHLCKRYESIKAQLPESLTLFA